MRKVLYAICVFCIAGLAALGCRKSRPEKLVEKIFVVNIDQDSSQLVNYLDHHKHIWPEVEAGFKKAGYRKITLARFNHLVVMTIQVPKGADLDSMSKVAESYSPKCAEWNRLMDTYQRGVPGTAPGQKWVEAVPFYSFERSPE